MTVEPITLSVSRPGELLVSSLESGPETRTFRLTHAN